MAFSPDSFSQSAFSPQAFNFGGEPVTVSPEVATVRFAGLSPTIVRGPVTVSPSAIVTRVLVLDPRVVRGNAPQISTLAHSPADIVGKLLVDIGHGVNPDDRQHFSPGDWPVFVTNEPNKPDNCITIYKSAGRIGPRDMITGRVNTKHGIQVRVRSTNTKIGWRKADQIRIALFREVYQKHVALEGLRYLVHSMVSVGVVNDQNKETPTSKRNIFTIDAMVVLKQLYQ